MNAPVPAPPRRCRPLVLIGFMGSGKSTVGRGVAMELDVDFADADVAIERRAGRPIASIFTTDGEPAFRALEHDVIINLLQTQRCRPQRATAVISIGGGAAMHPGTRAGLRQGAFIVHLRVSLPVALNRVGADPNRPMLARPDLDVIHAERMTAYDHLSDLVIDTDDLTVDEVISRVASAVRKRTELLNRSGVA